MVRDALTGFIDEPWFGPLDAAVKERVDRADSETLLCWADRVLIAESLSDVFASE